jgi:hypothetical protein
MSNTYHATEVSPEEYTATLAEAAELALADYYAHLDQLEVGREYDDDEYSIRENRDF